MFPFVKGRIVTHRENLGKALVELCKIFNNFLDVREFLKKVNIQQRYLDFACKTAMLYENYYVVEIFLHRNYVSKKTINSLFLDSIEKSERLF